MRSLRSKKGAISLELISGCEVFLPTHQVEAIQAVFDLVVTGVVIGEEIRSAAEVQALRQQVRGAG